MHVLVVNGFARDDESADLVEHVQKFLTDRGHEVRRSDLALEGFDSFMSADERAAYHSDRPLITPETVAAAEAVRWAAGLVVCYPIVHGTAPPRVKSWQERVFVLGVGFEFLPSGRITGALDLDRACVVGVEPVGAGRGLARRQRSDRRNDFGPSLARSFYLSSNRRCRSRYVGIDPDRVARVERVVGRW
ncbi:MAG: NAD(P)H-dependent oxidoreductase [Acidimicrobiia bacterium]|nr:NAD(P)H-dependent oxidoreductase [Acidimicrobiia bacterium]